MKLIEDLDSKFGKLPPSYSAFKKIYFLKGFPQKNKREYNSIHQFEIIFTKIFMNISN